MNNTIKISHLCKQFRMTCAVDDVNIETSKGEIIALLGPNGAGKSTLMNMISGFLAPTCGNICILGKNITNEPIDCKKSIGFLPEGAPMYSDLTVYDFLNYMAELRGLRSKAKKDRIKEVCMLAQIENVCDFKIETLSKGYQRRVGFAQSILADPPILLLDEPTDGLDPNQKEHLRKLIKQMGKGKTLIISTHLLEDAEEICNRIMIMNHGKIIADGSKEDILKIAKTKTLATAFRKLTGGINA